MLLFKACENSRKLESLRMMNADSVDTETQAISTHARLLCSIEHRLTLLGLRAFDDLGSSRFVRKADELLTWTLSVYTLRSVWRVFEVTCSVSVVYRIGDYILLELSHSSDGEHEWVACFSWEETEERVPPEVRAQALKNSQNNLMQLISMRFGIPWLEGIADDRSIGGSVPLTNEQTFQIIDLLGQHFASA